MARTPKELFTGTGVALVTPFFSDGIIDFHSLKSLVTSLKNKVEYLVVLGTTGESATLSESEQNQVLETVLDANAGQLPIVLGLGGNSTQELITKAKSFNWKGVSGVLSVSPYYNKPSQKGIIAHYKALAESLPVPLILYNVPGRTASNMLPATVLELATHPNITGIKEASGSLEQAVAIALEKPDDFLLISGDDMLTLPMITAGAVGAISVIANLMPDAFGSMVRMGIKGDFEQAKKYWFNWAPINDLMYSEGNPVGIKQALALAGICSNEVRLPLVKASADLAQAIDIKMKALSKNQIELV